MLSWERICKITDEPNLEERIRDRAWVEIDLSALDRNVRNLRRLLSPQTAFMAVVKADAYGHGAIPVAQTVLEAGADWLGVATVSEGIELRQAGISAPILVLGATTTAEQLRALVRWQLQPTLCSPKQALVFSEHLSGEETPLSVHLKLDTGMSRLGVSWDEAIAFVQLVRRLPNLQIASVYSHLAAADDRDPTVTNRQHQRFETAIARLKAAKVPLPCLHLSNSAATLSSPTFHYDLVRLGLALYGLYPAPHFKSTVELSPVMQVKARVTQVKTVPPGTGVSYGHQFVTQRTTRLAVVGIGYADGVPRNLSNRMEVLLSRRGRVWRIPQVGAITMDQLMLDVTDVPEVRVGDVVTVLGRVGSDRISAEDWAIALDTISWEILCGFKHRLPRIKV
ncbi:alanine racemase [Leptolyngbya valderiana BDU 20041]|uniref:alanine racemase n=1 Tax=Baaleninema simplex TaxID=2862350 RepID=UPI0003457160|nr:alanine racemase [Baaleninema simplex]MDC0832317.1 alanine racemase [Geitlerinema sp. CS-897]OAB62899.1 alanine racemase [Leptolyngbya valderiana BDU 20041]PPT05596.1 Alanine racemase [Geitlerinema sp. FC II]